MKVASFVLALMAARPAAAAHLASGRVVDASGRPQPRVIVCAADPVTDRVVAMAASDDSGQVRLSLPDRRPVFGVLSDTLGVRKVVSRGPDHFELVLTPLPEAPPAPADRSLTAIVNPHAVVLRGRVVDETGAPLAGVRIDALRPAGTTVTTGFSAATGTFAIALPSGETRLRPWAPGLVLLRSSREGDRVVLVMTVSSEVETLVITTGRVLTFRPEDSIDPAYTPPAPVKAWLRYAYGICPSAPLTAWEKRALKKYWYLDVLRSEPPNPASISTATCTTPSAFQSTGLPPATIAGFDIWREGLPGQP